MEILILNLLSRPDRLTHILKECDKLEFLNKEPIVIEAISPLSSEFIPSSYDFNSLININNRFNINMYALNQSMVKVFEYAKSNNIDSFLLLEDDTTFFNNVEYRLNHILNINIDYDVIQLSSYHYFRPEYFHSDLYKVSGSWLANMNIYNHTSYDKCLDLLKQERPFDLSLGMCKYLKHGLKIYAYNFNLAHGGKFDSDIAENPEIVPEDITTHKEIIPYEILNSNKG